MNVEAMRRLLREELDVRLARMPESRNTRRLIQVVRDLTLLDVTAAIHDLETIDAVNNALLTMMGDDQ